MRLEAAVLVLGAAALAGCGALDPFPTVPRATQPGQPTGTRVAICYTSLSATSAEVRARAQSECPQNTVAEPTDTEWYLQNCPLLLPVRATFVCMPEK